MQVQFKKMNWFQRVPVYEQMQAWREKHRAATEDFQSASASAMSTIATAQIDLFAGRAQITAQTVIDQTQKALKEKTQNAQDKFSETQNLLDTTA
jgi:hypothetical protein